ncbi:unnamed protein product [Ceutorhynchus assimilis]|uniref:Uncharacterized protein n=1 Tax=Ceutorhynchus assimilis TaxID=467358 RepID=A0A9N9MGP9_9CUCU|nr:unnamed protein product [Ceutorhynchus assimilis]
MMKYLFLVVTVFAAVKAQQLTQEEIEKFKKIHSDCMKETSVDEAVMLAAMRGEYTEDEKLKNQILCANKKIGFQKENGDIDEEVLFKKLVEKFSNETLVKAAVKQCAQKKDNPAETGFQMTKCLHSMAPTDLKVESYF